MEDKRTEMKVVSGQPIDPETGKFDESPPPPFPPRCEYPDGCNNKITDIGSVVTYKKHWYCHEHYGIVRENDRLK